MGSIGGWIRAFAGFFIIGATVVFSEPMFEIMDAIAEATGADAHPTLVFIRGARQYALILVGVALIISAFAESTTTEGGGYYR